MAVKRNYRINLRNYGNPPAVMVSQYDENYSLTFEVYDGPLPASGLNTYTVKLVGTRADTLKYSFDGTVTGVANNVLNFTIDTTMTACAGKGVAEIVILDATNDVKFASFNLPVYVEKAAVPDDAVDADVERAQEIAEQVEELIDGATEGAEAWAVGQRGGVDVESTDPTYHNNAKYYAESISGVTDQVATNTSDISDLKEDLNDVKELIADVDTHQETSTETTTPTWAQGYIAPDGSVGSSTTLYYCTPINVSEGDVIRPERGDNGLITSVYYLTAYHNNSAVSALGGRNVSMPYTVPSGVDKIVLTINSAYLDYGTPKIKRTYTYNVETLDPKFVDKSGVAQVKTQNIDGMGELATGVSENLFSKATLVASGKYVGTVSGTTGKAVLYDNASYDTYIVPVDGESTYTFTNVRFGCVVTNLEFTAVGSLLNQVTEIDSTDGNYVLFSFAPSAYPTATYVITKPTTYYRVPSNWVFDSPKNQKETVSGAITSDGTLAINGRSALKDGEAIAFKGFFETFNGFSLNFYGTAVTNYINVTGSSIEIKSTSITPTPINHGLTIENYVALVCELTNGKFKITLYSNSGSYSTTVDWNQINADVTQPQIVSNGTVFSNAILSVSYDATKRGVWYFGDSYVSVLDPARWAYYLMEDGFLKNILLNGASGGASGGAITSFGTLLKYGTPKIAVFGTGMNDGSDGSAPSATYVSRRTEFINLCKANSIEPIFCTVPTVPTVNNEKKNEWVRASGYKYIDFASAVGADGSGAWFSGMLSTDNVHPTVTGAKALYTQVLIDLPEITISN